MLQWIPPSTPVDIIMGSTIKLANGADLQWEFLFCTSAVPSDNPSNIVDFSDIANVVVSLQGTSDPHNLTQFWSFMVPNANIVNNVTAANWNLTQPNTLAQVTVKVPNALNQFTLTQAQGAFWLSVYGITTDATAQVVPYGFFPVVIIDTGIPVVTPVGPQPFKVGSKLSFVCSDGLTRDLSLQKTANGLWTANVNQVGYNGGGQALYSFLCSDTFYRDLSITLQQGVWTLNINQAGHS